MIKRAFLLGFVIIGVSYSLYGQQPPDDWDLADSQVKRIQPAVFSKLPKSHVGELQARRCTIPQTYGNRTLHNVIHGEFAKKGQTDWAVLCSKNRVSSILIFWGGSEKNVSEIAKGLDKGFLQGIGNGQIGYSREISVVGRKYILDHYKAYGGPKPPPISHVGINDAFIEKGSTVRYYYAGKWLELTGAD